MNKKQILIELEKDPRMIIPLLQDNDFAWAKELWGGFRSQVTICGVGLYKNIPRVPSYRFHIQTLATLTPVKQLEYIKETL